MFHKGCFVSASVGLVMMAASSGLAQTVVRLSQPSLMGGQRQLARDIELTQLRVQMNEDEMKTLALIPPGTTAWPRVSITALPDTGMLLQQDGQLIADVPAVVTDPRGRVIYVPPRDENGVTFVKIGYETTEAGQIGASRCVLSVDVAPVADPPQMLAYTFPPLTEDVPAVLNLSGKDVDFEHEGDVHSIRIVQAPSASFGVLRQLADDGTTMGDVINNGDIVTNLNGLITYVPSANYNGNATNFIYEIIDSAGLTSGLGWITLTVLPQNDAPVASNLATSMDQTMPFANLYAWGCTDVDNVPGELSMILATLPKNGRLYAGSVSPENLVTEPGGVYPFPPVWPNLIFKYVPNDHTLNPMYDEFTYSCTDGELVSAPAKISIAMTYKNIPPTMEVLGDLHTSEDGAPIEMTVVCADDADAPSAIRAIVTNLPKHGRLEFPNPIFVGSWIWVTSPNTEIIGKEFRYVPDPGYNSTVDGPDSFAIVAKDTQGDWSAPTMLTMTVAAVNDAPIIVGSSAALARIALPSGTVVSAVLNDLKVIDDAGPMPIVVDVRSTDAAWIGLVGEAVGVVMNRESPGAFSITGPLEAVNAALQAGVEYVPQTLGTGVLTISANDQGNVGDESPAVAHVISKQIVVVTTP